MVSIRSIIVLIKPLIVSIMSLRDPLLTFQLILMEIGILLMWHLMWMPHVRGCLRGMSI